MRIIAGTHRARNLESPPDDKRIRPTSDKMRGAIFNILEHAAFVPPLYGEHTGVLDLCCGTGALGFEALSRGLGEAVFIDSETASLALAKSNAQKFNLMARCKFLRASVDDLPVPPRRFELVFIDPPYNKKLIDAALPALLAGDWLAENAVIVAETQAREEFAVPAGLQSIERRRYGDSAVTFLMRG